MTTTLKHLLSGPSGDRLHAWLLPTEPREVTGLALLEARGEDGSVYAGGLDEGVLGVLSRSAQYASSGYQLDVLVRVAVDRRAAGLVLHQPARRSITATALAQRGGLTLLQASSSADPLALYADLASAVAGDARASMARIAAAADYQPPAQEDADSITAALGRALDQPLRFATGESRKGAVVEIEGRTVGRISSDHTSETAIVAETVAAGVLSRELSRRSREAMGPVRAGSSLLAALLLCSQANLAGVVERAWQSGMAVHGWHCAARVSLRRKAESGSAGALRDVDDPVTRDVAELVTELLAGRLDDRLGTWSVAQPDSTLVLVRTTREDPGREGGRLARQGVETILGHITERHPDLEVCAGLATAHPDAVGLRLSAEEARAALASAELAGHGPDSGPARLQTFDALGLQRMLSEWAATGTARAAVTDLLAPLDALGHEKAARGVQTLHAYLDERGSLVRAARRLHLHRNAVAYRITRLVETLNLDLDNPDQRFALQLACRARLMTSGQLASP